MNTRIPAAIAHSICSRLVRNAIRGPYSSESTFPWKLTTLTHSKVAPAVPSLDADESPESNHIPTMFRENSVFRTLVSAPVRRCMMVAGFVALGIVSPSPADAEPTITSADDGTGTVVTINGNQFDIDGGSLSGDGANLFHSFDQFGLSESQIANFLSNPEVQNILGRVVGGDASIIDGLVQITGGSSNLYLMNPAGVVFGPNAQLNLPAALTVTTANGLEFGSDWFSAEGINEYQSLVGNPTAFGFTSADSGAILNAGALSLNTGESLTLLGGSVINTGNLSVPEGQVTITAIPEEGVVRIGQEGHLLSLDIQPLSANESLPNDWTVPIVSLPILLTSGLSDYELGISANPDGSVSLDVVDMRVPTELGTTLASGEIDVSGELGGEVNVFGSRVGVIDAELDASGSDGGGDIRIGGSYQGEDLVPNADITFINKDSIVDTDALVDGDGGRVVVWSELATLSDGELSARGGINSGDGGLVETSSRGFLEVTVPPDTSAQSGLQGTWLLDPHNITILDAQTAGGDLVPIIGFGDLGVELSPPFVAIEDNAILPATLLQDALEVNGEVIVSTGTTGNQDGNITLNADLDFDGAGTGTLIFDAANDIIISPGSDIIDSDEGTLDSLNLTFEAGGNINIGSNTTTNSRGGNITLSAENSVIVSDDINTNGGNLSIISGNIIDSEEGILDTSSPLNAGNVVIQANDSVRTSLVDSTSNESGSGGNISILASNDIVIENDLNTSGIQRGGDVTVTSTNGSIFINGTGIEGATSEINTTALAPDGLGGEVTLTAEDTIITNSINADGLSESGNILLRGREINFDSSQADISISALDGELFIENTILDGEIEVSSISEDSNPDILELAAFELEVLSDGFRRIIIGDSESSGTIFVNPSGVEFSDPVTLQSPQEGGSIIIDGEIQSNGNDLTLISGDITDINADISTTGGSLSINSGGSIDSSQGILDSSSAFDGGEISLLAEVDIQASSIDSRSTEIGNGGLIQIQSNSSIKTEEGDISSSAVNGDGGSIDIEANTVLNLGDIDSTSIDGAGGSVELIATESISTGAIDSSSESGNAGNVSIDPINNVEVATINAEGGLDGFGGDVFVESRSGFFRATDSFTALNGVEASISTVGGLGGGDITIRHAGGPRRFPIQEFSVGDASINGTAAALTSGDFTIAPQFSTLGSFRRGNISIETDDLGSGTPELPDDEDNLPRETLPPLGPDLGASTLSASTGVICSTGGNADYSSIEQSYTSEFQSALGMSSQSSSQASTNVCGALDNVAAITGVEPAVIYVDFSPTELSAQSNSNPNPLLQPSDTDSLELVLATSSGETIFKRVPEATRMEVLDLALQFRESLTDETSRLLDDDRYLPAAQKLYEWLIDPLEESLEENEVENLVFVMPAGLRTLPIAALHDSEDNQFLVEKYSAGLTPSLQLTNTRYASLSNTQLLAMGSSEFPTDSALDSLPAASFEASILASNFWPGQSFTNTDFTLDNLRGQRQQNPYGIVHLATHADFESSDPSSAFIQMWDRKIRLEDLGDLGWNDPLVKLLVLSACRTAVGNPDSEYGFAGLAARTGVQSVVASLWRVNDLEALALMTDFYAQLNQAPIKAEALRQAQLAMLNGEIQVDEDKLILSDREITLPPELSSLSSFELTHPFYWASFTMVGSPW